MIANSIPTILTNTLISLLKSEYLYLDPGSGSILIQLLIASALGAVLILKTSWSKIKNFFHRIAPNRNKEDAVGDNEE